MKKINFFGWLPHICLLMFLAACGGGGGGAGGVSPRAQVVGDIMNPDMVFGSAPERTVTNFEDMVGTDLAGGSIDLGGGYTLESGSLLLKKYGEVLLRAAGVGVYDGDILIATNDALQERFKDLEITHWEKEGGGSTGYSVPKGSELASGRATVQGVLVMSNLLKYATFGYWAEYWEFEFDNGKSLSEISFEKAFYGGSRQQNAPSSGSFTGKAVAVAYEYLDEDQYQNHKQAHLFGEATLNVTNSTSGTLALNFTDFANLNANLSFDGNGAINGTFTSVSMSGSNATGIDLTSILAGSQPAGKYISNRVEGQFYGLVNATEAAGSFKLQEAYMELGGSMGHFSKGIQGAFGVKNY